MAEQLVNPPLAVSGYHGIRNAHPCDGKIVLDPTLDSIAMFSLDCQPPLAADVPVTIAYTLTGNTTGSVRAVVMGASTASQSGDGTYSETITPTGETTAVQFRTSVNANGEIAAPSVNVS